MKKQIMSCLFIVLQGNALQCAEPLKKHTFIMGKDRQALTITDKVLKILEQHSPVIRNNEAASGDYEYPAISYKDMLFILDALLFKYNYSGPASYVIEFDKKFRDKLAIVDQAISFINALHYLDIKSLLDKSITIFCQNIEKGIWWDSYMQNPNLFDALAPDIKKLIANVFANPFNIEYKQTDFNEFSSYYFRLISRQGSYVALWNKNHKLDLYAIDTEKWISLDIKPEAVFFSNNDAFMGVYQQQIFEIYSTQHFQKLFSIQMAELIKLSKLQFQDFINSELASCEILFPSDNECMLLFYNTDNIHFFLFDINTGELKAERVYNNSTVSSMGKYRIDHKKGIYSIDVDNLIAKVVAPISTWSHDDNLGLFVEAMGKAIFKIYDISKKNMLDATFGSHDYYYSSYKLFDRKKDTLVVILSKNIRSSIINEINLYNIPHGILNNSLLLPNHSIPVEFNQQFAAITKDNILRVISKNGITQWELNSPYQLSFDQIMYVLCAKKNKNLLTDQGHFAALYESLPLPLKKIINPSHSFWTIIRSRLG